MIATTTEPKCIADQRAKLTKQLADLDSLAAHVVAAESVFAGVGEVRICNINIETRVDVYLDDYRQIVPYLRELAGRGYHPTRFSPLYETDDKTTRCYSRNNMKIWVHLTGKGCQRVQVGTKEIPVWEIQCGETAEQTA